MSKYYKKYYEKFIYVNLLCYTVCMISFYHIVVLNTKLSDIFMFICNILNLDFESITKYLKVQNLISNV